MPFRHIVDFCHWNYSGYQPIDHNGFEGSAGNFIYLVGEFSMDKESFLMFQQSTPQVYRALHQAITSGLVRSAHDLSEGGLAVAAAEMCIGGRLGIEL